MKITQKTWYFFLILSFLSLAVWFRFTYPQFSFIDLSVTKNSAVLISKSYLSNDVGADISEYRHAAVFSATYSADQYLQQSLGFEKELQFLRENRFELFFWRVRFFRENQQEEYHVTVSAASGEVVSYNHIIEASAFRSEQSEEEAKAKAMTFLISRFDVDPAQFTFHKSSVKKQDHRVEYSFSWEKKGIFVRWSPEEGTGGAKLLTSATVTGDEILSFSKQHIIIPEQFQRYIAQQQNVGYNLIIIFRYIFFSLLTASIFYVIVRRNDLVMQSVKNFSLGLTGALFLLHVLSHFNIWENVLYNYPTTSSFASYLWQYISGNFMGVFIVTISILMPVLAGESLHYEAYPNKKTGAFLHYIKSSFFSKKVFSLVLLGYLGAIIMVGIQSAAFAFGERHLGVWVEYTWMTQLAQSEFPFIAALVLGFNAAFTEEISFRLFSISLGKKFLNSTMIAVILASVIWGYGHSTYPVYPMWFRGLEVTILGFFLSFVYLRYGIIPVLVAHFLFDVFWSSSAYLLGQSTTYLFVTSILVLLLPLVLGIIAFLFNRSDKEDVMRWQLSEHQKYNLAVLKHYLQTKNIFAAKSETQLDQLKKEIISHGWDIAVVEMTFEELRAGATAHTSS